MNHEILNKAQELEHCLSSSPGREEYTDCDEGLRAIAYSMDIMAPGLYAWFGKVRIRLGGYTPDDKPYRYPGTIHSSAGIALVLPGYRILTTYQGSYDPKQAYNSGSSKL